MTPRLADSERTAEVEAEILEAASDLLADGGFEALSMRVVAERVGVSAPAIYHYFESKDALVMRVLESAFARFGGYLESAVQQHQRGSLERVTALGEAYIRFAFENEAYFRLLFLRQHPHPRNVEDLPEGGGYAVIREAVVDAIASGAMRDVNPDLMVMYLWCSVHGLVTVALHCRMHEDGDCMPEGIPTSPVELFQAFRPILRDGIRRVDQAATAEPVVSGSVRE